jgi:hypothetical protein
MVKMINKHFGNEMLVAESRVEEYLSAGHTLADIPEAEKKPKSKPKKSAKKTK